MTGYVMKSTPMVYTPGILKWARHGYKTGDKDFMVNFILDSYFDGRQEAMRSTVDRLLSGALDYRVEGEDVVFEIGGLDG